MLNLAFDSCFKISLHHLTKKVLHLLILVSRASKSENQGYRKSLLVNLLQVLNLTFDPCSHYNCLLASGIHMISEAKILSEDTDVSHIKKDEKI